MTNLSPQDTFQLPPDRYAPSGTLRFDDDERVDLHKANPEFMTPAELARFATELALPKHTISAHETVDRGRVEFGEGVVTTLERTISPSIEWVDTATLTQAGKAIIAFRTTATMQPIDSQKV